HSEATRYPWYSYIAPVSLLLRNNINEGRTRLNLTRWSEYPASRRIRALTGIANQVTDGEMPPQNYTWLHRDAKLTESDKKQIFDWTQTERRRLIAESAHAQ